MPMRALKAIDPTIEYLLKKEYQRQQNTLSLIPSENIASNAVIEALGSVATNKYSEGYSGKRYYGGNEIIDRIETLAIERAKKMFGTEHANVQAYSGSPANQAVYMALLQPGDTVVGMALPAGGHLTHGWKVSFSGKSYRAVQYGVDKNGYLDYDEIADLVLKEKPQLVICGATAYSRIIDFKKFRQIADSVGAYLLADISHISGLVVGGVHPSPAPYADVIMTTTHKSLRGPRGALVMARSAEVGVKIDKAVFPGLQGGPHNHQTAAIAVCLKEANTTEFKSYAKKIIENAKVLASELENCDFSIVTGGTENHLFLIDLTNKGVTGQEAEDALSTVGIIVNKNMVPGDPRSPFDPSGLRVGTPSVTTRGLTIKDMKTLASIINDVTVQKPDRSVLKKAKDTVNELCKRYPAYPR
ncbi:MAG: serine hydroxymethyltransferase [bacterium]|nr:serine hydroxymethyltransferase [bacterium]